jgi:hypothetical protein
MSSSLSPANGATGSLWHAGPDATEKSQLVDVFVKLLTNENITIEVKNKRPRKVFLRGQGLS